MLASDAASRWAGWALAHLEFWNSVNPIQTREADYVHHITACPPGFESLAASLYTSSSHFVNLRNLLIDGASGVQSD